jgi:hypothetical protein
LNTIKKNIEERQSQFNNQNKKYSDLKHKLLDTTKEQLQILDTEINSIITSFRKYKEITEDKIKNLYKAQIEVLDENKKIINQNVSTINQILASVLRMNQKLESIFKFKFRPTQYFL